MTKFVYRIKEGASSVTHLRVEEVDDEYIVRGMDERIKKSSVDTTTGVGDYSTWKKARFQLRGLGEERRTK